VKVRREDGQLKVVGREGRRGEWMRGLCMGIRSDN